MKIKETPDCERLVYYARFEFQQNSVLYTSIAVNKQQFSMFIGQEFFATYRTESTRLYIYGELLYNWNGNQIIEEEQHWLRHVTR